MKKIIKNTVTRIDGEALIETISRYKQQKQDKLEFLQKQLITLQQQIKDLEDEQEGCDIAITKILIL